MKQTLFWLFLLFQAGIIFSQADYGDDYWGTHILNYNHITGEQADKLAGELEKFEFRYVRLWDTKTDWQNLEPARGVYNWELFERYLLLCKKSGLKPIMTLAMTPRWASSKPEQPCVYGKGAAAMPKDIGDWIDFITVIATRYKDDIHEWEIWNEPNNTFVRFFKGSHADLARLVITAAIALKKVNPENRVIAPAMVVQPGSNIWLRNFFDTAGKIAREEYDTRLSDVIDVISFHYYVPYPPLDFLDSNCKVIKKIMADFGLDNKELWLTEVGIDTGWVKDPARYPDLLKRVTRIPHQNGVKRLYYYAWTSRNMRFTPFEEYAPFTNSEEPVITDFGKTYMKFRNLEELSDK